MSNNAPDYENDLVFPPQEIKSQDDVKHQDTRSSDVLIKAVETCQKLEKELIRVVSLLCLCDGKIDGYYEQTNKDVEKYLTEIGFIIERDEDGEIKKPEKQWVKELVYKGVR